MGLISYNKLNDNTPADANSINNRVAPVYDEINGNLDSQNIRSGGVEKRNLASQSVSADKLEPQSVTPSKMNNVWVGKSKYQKWRKEKSWKTLFNKTISLAESSYLYILFNGVANNDHNNTDSILDMEMIVNDEPVMVFDGHGAMEIGLAAPNKDYSVSMSGMTTSKQSGDVNIKIRATTRGKNGGGDIRAGFVRIDALGDGTYLK